MRVFRTLEGTTNKTLFDTKATKLLGGKNQEVGRHII